MENPTFRPTITVADATTLRYVLSKAKASGDAIGLSAREVEICKTFERKLVRWIGRAEADAYVRDTFGD